MITSGKESINHEVSFLKRCRNLLRTIWDHVLWHDMLLSAVENTVGYCPHSWRPTKTWSLLKVCSFFPRRLFCASFSRRYKQGTKGGKKKKVWPKRHCKSILLLSVHLSLALRDHQRTRAAIKNLSQLKLARRRDVDDLGSNDTSFISKIYILQGIKRSVQKS